MTKAVLSTKSDGMIGVVAMTEAVETTEIWIPACEEITILARGLNIKLKY